jgi:hypothetical protein
MTRTANVEVAIKFTLADDYTGEIGTDVEDDVLYVLEDRHDDFAKIGRFEVERVSCPVIDDDEPLEDE